MQNIVENLPSYIVENLPTSVPLTHLNYTQKIFHEK